MEVNKEEKVKEDEVEEVAAWVVSNVANLFTIFILFG